MDAPREILSMKLYEPLEVVKQIKGFLPRIYSKVTKGSKLRFSSNITNIKMKKYWILYVPHILSNHKTVINPTKSNIISL